jgi:peptidoglycan/xylan/chitin deacetylase (PgdA/CDA1 family)
MRRITAIAYAFLFCVIASSASAGECTNPNALGTSRTLVMDTSHLKLGALQYNETLPLADREVVLTFDDGPLGPYTTRILDLLAAECVKATYFLVGTMAQSNPALVKRIVREGHTVGSHSLNHPLTFDTMPLPNAERQIDGGIAMVQAALGDQGKLAPFFRIPGLARSTGVENLLAQRTLVTWSVDLVADDWHRGITANEIAERALRRIAARGRGILLLHDIHPATALAMPAILRGLKAGGYRIVHVVPAGPGRPATYSEPQQWAAHKRRSRIVIAEGVLDPRRPVPSLSLHFGAKSLAPFTPAMEAQHVMAAAGDDFRLPRSNWTDEEHAVIPHGMAPQTADMNWPEQLHFASLSTEDAVWPVLKPVPAAEPGRETRKRTLSHGKPAKPASAACRGSEFNPRCKKPVGGHQLSLTGPAPPDRLRSLYQF